MAIISFAVAYNDGYGWVWYCPDGKNSPFSYQTLNRAWAAGQTLRFNHGYDIRVYQLRNLAYPVLPDETWIISWPAKYNCEPYINC